MLKLIPLFALMSFAAFAASELPLKPYLNIQEALAKDDFETAKKSLESLCKEEGKFLSKNYKDCGETFKDIDAFRESFKALSKVYIEQGKKSELEKLIKVECPMAKAKWLQRPGSVANPYYGSSMLTCGMKI